MRILVTGANGHLGAAVMELLAASGHKATGLDLKAGAGVDLVGDLAQADWIAEVTKGFDAVLHTATLHKPHVATHSRQDFVNTNITGSLDLLDAATRHNIPHLVMASTTSVYALALRPQPDQPAVWVDEDLPPAPKNIYGITKVAAEDLCRLASRKEGLRTTILRFSRFFPEADDSAEMRSAYADENAKANEFLFRRIDLEDAAQAMIAALDRPKGALSETMIVSATTPFSKGDLKALNQNALPVVERLYPRISTIYKALGYRMFEKIGRVYDNQKARNLLDWTPRHSFETVLEQLQNNLPIGSALARKIGVRGYHDVDFTTGPYPVDE